MPPPPSSPSPSPPSSPPSSPPAGDRGAGSISAFLCHTAHPSRDSARFLLSPPIRLPPLLSKNAVTVLVMMKLDVLVKFRKQGSKRCRLWSCLRRTSVLMVPWLWVGVKGHLNIQPMPHKPDNGYHLHHHNHRYQHHHHPQLISSSPHFHNTRHPRCKIS